MSDALSEPSSFTKRAHELRSRFQEAASLISGYVQFAQRGLEHMTVEHSKTATLIKQVHETRGKIEVRNKNGSVTQLDDEQIRVLDQAVSEHATRVTRYPEMIREMAFIYLVAAFDAYVQDTLAAAFQARPEILKSGKQLTVEKAVELTMAGTLLQYLAEREAHELGYRSFADQIRYFKDQFNLSLEAEGVTIDVFIEIHARRNQFVHNAGLVNQRYLDAVRHSSAELGERLAVTQSYWDAAHALLRDLVRRLHECMVTKLSPNGKSVARA